MITQVQYFLYNLILLCMQAIGVIFLWKKTFPWYFIIFFATIPWVLSHYLKKQYDKQLDDEFKKNLDTFKKLLEEAKKQQEEGKDEE